MSWRSRNLHLLYVNDDPGSAGDDESAFAARAAHFVHVEPIDNLHSATEALLRHRLSTQRRFVDFVFCDANMILDSESHADDVMWDVIPGEDAILAYGPLLALPFLFAPPWCQFVPFSAFWTDPNVSRNGYTLVALSMILTVIEGKQKTTTDVRNQIETWKNKGKVTSLSALLPSSLPRIREKIVELCKDDALWLNGIDTTIHQLELWKLQATEAGFEKQALPLALGNDPICVEIMHSGDHIHLIHVSSLFADVLGFRKPTSVEPIKTIISTLEQWTKLDHAYPLQTRDAYHIARKLLFNLMPGNPEEDAEKLRFWKLMLKDKIVKNHGIASGSDKFYFVVRLAMLLSFTRAWYLVKNQPFTVADIRKLVFHFLGVDRPSESGDATPQNVFKRLLGEKAGTIVGVEPYQHPFKDLSRYQDAEGKISVLEAYMLDDEDEEGALDWRERLLCRYFVQAGHVHCDDEPEPERTAWSPAHYPRWMRA